MVNDEISLTPAEAGSGFLRWEQKWLEKDKKAEHVVKGLSMKKSNKY